MTIRTALFTTIFIAQSVAAAFAGAAPPPEASGNGGSGGAVIVLLVLLGAVLLGINGNMNGASPEGENGAPPQDK